MAGRSAQTFDGASAGAVICFIKMSMTASPSKVATGRTALTESLSCPAGPGIRIAMSRSRLFGMNMPLLMWFITT